MLVTFLLFTKEDGELASVDVARGQLRVQFYHATALQR